MGLFLALASRRALVTHAVGPGGGGAGERGRIPPALPAGALSCPQGRDRWPRFPAARPPLASPFLTLKVGFRVFPPDLEVIHVLYGGLYGEMQERKLQKKLQASPPQQPSLLLTSRLTWALLEALTVRPTSDFRGGRVSLSLTRPPAAGPEAAAPCQVPSPPSALLTAGALGSGTPAL